MSDATKKTEEYEALVVLREPHLRALLRGGEVRVHRRGEGTVRVILQDIGFSACQIALDLAIDGRDTYQGYEETV